MNREEILNLYYQLVAKQERILAIEKKMVEMYHEMGAMYGWMVARAFYDGHEDLRLGLSYEYHRLFDKIDDVLEL